MGLAAWILLGRVEQSWGRMSPPVLYRNWR